MLHLPLRAANLILGLSTGVLEDIVKSECQIGIPLVLRRRPFDIHLAAVWKRETNVDLVQYRPFGDADRVLSARPGTRLCDPSALRVAPRASRRPLRLPGFLPCLEIRFQVASAFAAPTCPLNDEMFDINSMPIA